MPQAALRKIALKEVNPALLLWRGNPPTSEWMRGLLGHPDSLGASHVRAAVAIQIGIPKITSSLSLSRRMKMVLSQPLEIAL